MKKLTLVLTYLLTYLLLLLILSGCSNSDGGTVYHPVEEYLPHHELINKSAADIPEHEKSGLEASIQKLQESRKLFTIGEFTNGNVDYFGNIMDVDSDSDGNIYFLDDRTFRIRAYDKYGEMIGIFGGRQGRGPTDLFMPRAIHVDGNGFVYVAEGFFQVKVLTLAENGIELHKIIEIPDVTPADICTMNDELFVRSIAIDPSCRDSLDYKTIHVYSSTTGEYKRSFGEIYNSPRNRVNRMMSRDGRIECIEEKNLVITTFFRFGYVYAYGINGNLKWATKLLPFQDMETTEEVRQGIGRSWSLGVVGSYISTLSKYNEDLIMIQTITNEAGQSRQRPNLNTHFIHSDSGKTFAVFENYVIPWTLHFSHGRYFVKAVGDTSRSGIELDVFEIQNKSN